MIITVNQLNRFLKGMMDNEPILNSLTVEGELSDVRYSGNLYFVMRDSEAQIDCVAVRIGSGFNDGDYVLAKGKISFYERRGKITLFVQEMVKTDRFGLKFKEFLELKEEFQKKGYFDALSKKEICKFPERIGVITSPTGSVIKDIINVVKRRYPISNIVVYPTKVQGLEAHKELAEGVIYFSESNVDTVIIARGGGSDEDLACFNDRNLVEAIYACKKPVISAVGHETDFTLCDFVADCRASTPSVAAELATPYAVDIVKSLTKSLKSSYMLQKKRLSAKYVTVNGSIWKIFHEYSSYFIHKKQSVIKRLRVAERSIGKEIKKSFLALRKLKDSYYAEVSSLNVLSEAQGKRAEALGSSPLGLLKSGYVRLLGKSGIITRVAEIKEGDILSTRLIDGSINVEVIETNEEDV